MMMPNMTAGKMYLDMPDGTRFVLKVYGWSLSHKASIDGLWTTEISATGTLEQAHTPTIPASRPARKVVPKSPVTGSYERRDE